MYCYVRLLNGFEKTLVYKVPAQLSTTMLEGAIVSVPVQRRIESALVISRCQTLNETRSFLIKEILGLERSPDDTKYARFIQKIAYAYFIDPLHFYQKIRAFLRNQRAEEPHDAPPEDVLERSSIVTLTAQQAAVVQAMAPYITTPSYQPTLLHGVTGSGKTEVYKALIEKTVAAGKSVILMLPEVSLSLQFQHLLKKQMPHLTFFGFHSATKASEKRTLWNALCEHKPIVIVGVHLPVLLPVANLGLIIIDEEHEQGFNEKKHPKLNSKELALWRAREYGLPILLGSATPSITSLASVQRNQWKLFSITERFKGAFPTLQKVVLTEQRHLNRRFFWISKQLEEAIKQCLARKEQAIIYLNRRGFSFFVQCKACGFIFQCPSCSVSLTLHMTNSSPIHGFETLASLAPHHEREKMPTQSMQSKDFETSNEVKTMVNGMAVRGEELQSSVSNHTASIQLLRCHYCDYQRPLPPACPTCKAGPKELLKKGVGTQQIVQMFQELFPQARIERADLDTTSKKRTWHETVTAFENGQIDLLIGTQTITKGYHFPKVTLVGIIWADINLHYPAYNASEIALQQIIQVAGRAGRCNDQSRVIIQTMHDHSIFNHCNEVQYIDFCHQELAARNEIGYPPFMRLVCIELKHQQAGVVERDAQQLFNLLEEQNKTLNLGITLLGPSLPIVYKIQNAEMRHIFLKTRSYAHIHALLKNIDHNAYTSSVFIVAHQ